MRTPPSRRPRQQVPAKARERRRAQLRGAARVARVEPPRPPRRRRSTTAQRVDRVRLDRERVAAVGAGDERGVAERPPQPGDLRLERVAARRGAAPQVVERAGPTRTTDPASSARRTSSSEVLPPGTGTSRPSRLTSTGPSTEISQHARESTAASGRCQRGVSAARDGRAMASAHPGTCSAASSSATTRRSPRSSRPRATATTRRSSSRRRCSPPTATRCSRGPRRRDHDPRPPARRDRRPRTGAATATSSTRSRATTSSTTRTACSSPGSPTPATSPDLDHKEGP